MASGSRQPIRRQMSARERERGELPSPILSPFGRKAGRGHFFIFAGPSMPTASAATNVAPRLKCGSIKLGPKFLLDRGGSPRWAHKMRRGWRVHAIYRFPFVGKSARIVFQTVGCETKVLVRRCRALACGVGGGFVRVNGARLGELSQRIISRAASRCGN